MYLRKIAKVNPTESQRALYDRMHLAIGRIEKAYSSDHVFAGALDVTRQELDRMELRTIKDIADWESGWLKLLGVK